MKKISLLALAAIVGTSAFAAVQVEIQTPQKVEISTVRRNSVKSLPIKMSTNKIFTPKHVAKTTPRKADATDVTAATLSSIPLYTPFNTMYTAPWSQEGKGIYNKVGFTPAKSIAAFFPVFEDATSQEWAYTEYISQTESEDYTENGEYLGIKTEPLMEFSAPDLTITRSSGKYVYNDSAFEYVAGGDPTLFGFPEAVGLTFCPYSGGDWFLTYTFGFNKEPDADDAKLYNSNGVLLDWADFFQPEEDEDNSGDDTNEPAAQADEASEYLYTDFKVTGFSYYIPQMLAPYQMSEMYILASRNAKADVNLTATFYGYDTTTSKLDKTKIMGRGTASIEEGNGTAVVVFTVRAVNSNGRPTNMPICTSEPMFVEISGFDNENLVGFSPAMNFNQTFAESALGDDLSDAELLANLKAIYTAYDVCSYINFSALNTKTNEVENLVGYNGGMYYASEPGYAAMPTEMSIAFTANFPIIIDALTGSGDFELTFNREGGVDGIYLESTCDLAQYFEDGTLEYTAPDWVDCEIVFDEINSTDEYQIYDLIVTTEPMPEGATVERVAEIEFTGYACNFTVKVTQTLESSISEVIAAGQGAAEYYDLQGRKLSAAPAKGLYIERNGSAASTKLAR